MPSKNLYRHRAFWGFQKRLSVFHKISRRPIGKFSNGALARLHQYFHLRIFLIVGNTTALYDAIDKNPELIHIIFEGGKNIDMVPCNPAQQGNIGTVQVEFWSPVNGRRQYSSPSKTIKIIFFGQVHHSVETFQLCPDHIIDRSVVVLQYMQDHGSDRRLAMASADDHPGLVL